MIDAGPAGPRPRRPRAVHPRARSATRSRGSRASGPSASIVVLVAERSAGTPLVVEELIAARRELKHVSLTGTLADLIAARLARRSHECRRVLRLLAPSQRPMERDRLAVVSAAFEAELAIANVASNLPPRSSSMPRRAADGLDADLAAGLAEAIEHGFVREEPDGRLADPPRARRAGRRRRPAARPSARATRRRSRRRSTTPRSSPRRSGGPAHRLDGGAGRGARGRPAGDRRSRRRRTRSTRPELGLDLPAPVPVPGPDGEAADRVAGRRRAGRGLAARGRGGVRGRPTDRATVAYAESAPRGARRAAGPASSTPSSRRGSAATGWRRATAPARPPRCARAADVVPHEPSIERARILALLAQERMIAGAFRDAERAAREALDVARAVGAEAEPEAIHAVTTLAVVAGWGDDPEAAAAAAPRGGRPRRATRGLIEEWWRAMRQPGGHARAPRPARGGGRRHVSRACARRATLDLDAVYGNLLGGNVAGILVDVGRWRGGPRAEPPGARLEPGRASRS